MIIDPEEVALERVEVEELLRLTLQAMHAIRATARDKEIAFTYLSASGNGTTYTSLGRLYGLTPERIRQIVYKVRRRTRAAVEGKLKSHAIREVRQAALARRLVSINHWFKGASHA